MTQTLPPRGPARTCRVPVLMYHEIAGPPATGSRLAVSPDAFAAQLGYLAQEGYQTVTAAELFGVLTGAGGQLPGRPVVLTFDDGYADFHAVALPLLKRHAFTATLFVTTGWVQDAGAQSAGRPPGRMLSWSQIAEVAGAGIEVAAHSRRHQQLDQLPARLLRDDLLSSKTELEDRLGFPVTGLAYPYGYSSAGTRHVARDLGYDYACAVANRLVGAGADLHALPRLTVRRSTSLPAFQRIAGGPHAERMFVMDRALTRSWALVRRTRAVLGSVSRGK